MNDVLMSLEGQTVTIAIDGTASGDHDAVDLVNVHVARVPYSPNRQQTAIAYLRRLGAILIEAVSGELLAAPHDHDPFLWY